MDDKQEDLKHFSDYIHRTIHGEFSSLLEKRGCDHDQIQSILNDVASSVVAESHRAGYSVYDPFEIEHHLKTIILPPSISASPQPEPEPESEPEPLAQLLSEFHSGYHPQFYSDNLVTATEAQEAGIDIVLEHMDTLEGAREAATAIAQNKKRAREDSLVVAAAAKRLRAEQSIHERGILFVFNFFVRIWTLDVGTREERKQGKVWRPKKSEGGSFTHTRCHHYSSTLVVVVCFSSDHAETICACCQEDFLFSQKKKIKQTKKTKTTKKYVPENLACI